MDRGAWRAPVHVDFGEIVLPRSLISGDFS